MLHTCKVCELMQMVDALACLAEEGRETPAKVIGEPVRGIDPMVSEWGNPLARKGRYFMFLEYKKVTRGTEISKYPEE